MYIILLKENCCDGTAPFQTIPMHVNIVLIANLSTTVLSGNALWTNNEYGSSDLATGEEKYLRINGN